MLRQLAGVRPMVVADAAATCTRQHLCGAGVSTRLTPELARLVIVAAQLAPVDAPVHSRLGRGAIAAAEAAAAAVVRQRRHEVDHQVASGRWSRATSVAERVSEKVRGERVTWLTGGSRSRRSTTNRGWIAQTPGPSVATMAYQRVRKRAPVAVVPAR